MLGIAAVLRYTGSLDYATVFAHAGQIAAAQIHVTGAIAWPAITFTCICLFIGAMGKSAQVPLHVWLPDSMEGPTPISALIHAATMVTAGIFMVARMSPLFELSETALSFVLVIGATTAFFMGLLGIVNNDIKRVIAYSTLSQLGYMTVALGASAYGAGDIPPDDARVLQGAAVPRGGLGDHRHAPRAGHAARWAACAKYMPITYWTFLVGALALIGFPGFSGLLLQGPAHRRGACVAPRRVGLRVLLRAGGRVHHGALHLPHVLHDLPRQGAHGPADAASICTRALGGDGAAGRCWRFPRS